MVISLAFLLMLAMSGPLNAEETEITFWTQEVEAPRMEIQNELAEEFSEKYPDLTVNIVPVDRHDMVERLTAAYAADDLPDAIFHSLEFSIGLAQEGLISPERATQVVDNLDKETFHQGPLSMLALDENQFASVPGDGWGQLLLYREDLFEEEGLDRPDTWDNILEAANTLHDPPLMWGIQVGTDPGDAYMLQIFEHFALSNNARVYEDGEIMVDSPEFRETMEFYKELADFTPEGLLYWLHTRTDYLAGKTPMIVWSPYILDDVSGYVEDMPIAVDDLADKTGLVTSIQGSSGEEAQYGSVRNFSITPTASPETDKWVEFLLTEGQSKWLSMAPQGKFPMRRGTKENPNEHVENWGELPMGEEVDATIGEVYGEETLDIMAEGAEEYDRWFFAEGKGDVATSVYGTLEVAEIIREYIDGDHTLDEAIGLIEESIISAED